MKPELEIYLSTYDGAQHLRLHGWLKRNNVLIRSENIINSDDKFGTFLIYCNDDVLNKLKEINLEQNMFCDMEYMGGGSIRWDAYKETQIDPQLSMLSNIKDFMFSLNLESKEDLDNFVAQANETSLKLFKKSKGFIQDYVTTESLSSKEKIRDLEIMIEHFIDNGERYEDCVLLQNIKEEIINNEIQGYVNRNYSTEDRSCN